MSSRSFAGIAVALLLTTAIVSTVPAQVLPGGSTKHKSHDDEPKSKSSSPKKSKKSSPTKATPSASSSSARSLAAIPFGDSNGKEPINASGGVAIEDGRFLLCDNRTPDALYELRLDAGGRKVGALVRHSIRSVGGVEDMEGMAAVELEEQRFFVAVSSFGMRGGGKKGSGAPGSGLLRVDLTADGKLSVRRMTGVREWLVANYPELRATASLDPDRNGLNLEGLAWDPSRQALVFGVRTPLVGGRPLLLPVRLASATAEWTTASLEALPAITLAVDASSGVGVRSIDYDAERKEFWVALGRAMSGGKAPFALYVWDGSSEGRMRKLDGIVFDETMKVEGIVAGTIGGRNAILLLDDGGGYSVLWGDDARLR